MPATIVFLTFLLKISTPQGDRIKVEDLAVVKDRETCDMIAHVLNEFPAIKNDPNAQVVCREGKPPEQS